MTRTENRLPHAELHAVLAELIAELGAWQVLKTAAKHVGKAPARSRRGPVTLSDHVLEDLGRSALRPPPAPETLILWEGLRRTIR